jgi:hypothetical protein
VRSANIIIGTYERIALVCANLQCAVIPRSARFTRTLADAAQLVVVDEAHLIYTSRGVSLQAIIGITCRSGIHGLFLSGTAPPCLLETLATSYTSVHAVDAVAGQNQLRVDMVLASEAEVFEACVYSGLSRFLDGTRPCGWLHFEGTTETVFRTFQRYTKLTMEILSAWTSDDMHPLYRHAQARMALVQAAQIAPRSQWFQVASPYYRETPMGIEHVTRQHLQTFVAMSMGIGYHWRQLGVEYEAAVLSGMAKGDLWLCVCTSTLSAGVNVEGVRNVAIGFVPAHQDEEEQMRGRAARSCDGVSVCRARPVRPASRSFATPPFRAVFCWEVCQMAYSTVLSAVENDGRVLLTNDEWISRARSIPIQSKEVRETEARHVIRDLTESMGVARHDGEARLVLTLSPGTLRIYAKCPSFISDSWSFLSAITRTLQKHVTSETCLIPVYLYFLSRRDELPSIANIRFSTAFTFEELDFLGDWVRAAYPVNAPAFIRGLLAASTDRRTMPSYGAPLTEKAIRKMAILTLAVSLCLFGAEIDWRRFVPRETLAAIIPEIPPFADIAIECAQRLPGENRPLVAVLGDNQGIIRSAADMLSLDEGHVPEHIGRANCPLVAWATRPSAGPQESQESALIKLAKMSEAQAAALRARKDGPFGISREQWMLMTQRGQPGPLPVALTVPRSPDST